MQLTMSVLIIMMPRELMNSYMTLLIVPQSYLTKYEMAAKVKDAFLVGDCIDVKLISV